MSQKNNQLAINYRNSNDVPLNFIPGMTKPLNSPETLKRRTSLANKRNDGIHTSLSNFKTSFLDSLKGNKGGGVNSLNNRVHAKRSLDMASLRKASRRESIPSERRISRKQSAPAINFGRCNRHGDSKQNGDITHTATPQKKRDDLKLNLERNCDHDCELGDQTEHFQIVDENGNLIADTPYRNSSEIMVEMKRKSTGESSIDSENSCCEHDRRQSIEIRHHPSIDEIKDNTTDTSDNLGDMREITASMPNLAVKNVEKKKDKRISIKNPKFGRQRSRSSIELHSPIDENSQRLYFSRVETQLRSKLPRTFIATASIGLMNPMCIYGGARRLTSSQITPPKTSKKLTKSLSSSSSTRLDEHKRRNVFAKLKGSSVSIDDDEHTQESQLLTPFKRADAYIKKRGSSTSDIPESNKYPSTDSSLDYMT